MVLWEKVLQDEDNAQELFFGACKAGHSKIARMLIRKSAHLNIDLNKKSRTALCLWSTTSFLVADVYIPSCVIWINFTLFTHQSI